MNKETLLDFGFQIFKFIVYAIEVGSMIFGSKLVINQLGFQQGIAFLLMCLVYLVWSIRNEMINIKNPE